MTDADIDIDSEEERTTEEEPLESGAVVDGKYSIQRALGRGGTGTVYEARHVTIGHRVALKIVNADRAGRPETLARFQREAQICGAIRHPNVGQIYDVGTHKGRPYMVLELHEGQSLADVLDESVLPIPAVLEITLQVLSALAAVHDAGVVHRDVKPGNAMLVRALNGDIIVKLVDFGISKLVTADIRERTLTREGSILGSPDYMAPEQLRGYEVDARTDLYAVGVLLYEAVVGRPPFDAENLSDLMAAILRDPVVPPAELRTDCPAELDALIQKALARAPKDRFQNATEMARQLEQLRSGMRYTPGAAGIADLPKAPRSRSERITRARRARKHRAGDVTVPLLAAPSGEAVEAGPAEAIAAPRETRSVREWGPRGAMLVGLAALLGLTAFALRGEPEHVAPAEATASAAEHVVAQVPTSAAPLERVLASPPAAVEPDAGAVHEEPVQPPDRAAKRKRGRRSNSEQRASPAMAATDEPEAPNIRQQLDAASSAFVLGQMPRAKALYQEILDRSPSQADAWRGLGLVSNRMGQSKDAERAFERYLQLRPNAPDAARIREQLDKIR